MAGRGRGAGPRGPRAGRAPPGGEMVTGITANCGRLLAPALVWLKAGIDGRKFLEFGSFSEASRGGGGAGLCTVARPRGLETAT